MSTSISTSTTSPSPTSGRTTHSASCHCGIVTFSVTLSAPFPEEKVNECNCSICFQNGYLFVYPPRRDVVFHSGYETLGTYAFNTHQKAHRFCKTCGSSIMIDFLAAEHGEKDPARDILAINVRNFKDIDLKKMEYTYFDGKNLL